MSFFNKLFGGSNEPKTNAQPKNQPPKPKE